MKLSIVRLAFALLLVAGIVPAAAADECHQGFNAYAGASPYILNPAVDARALTKIVVVFEDIDASSRGVIPYRAVIRSVSSGEVVATRRGIAAFTPGVQSGIELSWDARDSRGQLVADGEYSIEVVAARHDGVPRIDFDRTEVEETTAPVAHSSEVRVVVDRAARYDFLFEPATRERLRAESQATGLDTSFPYQYFFGTNHAHTSWSDGGMPNTDCTSGHYGYAGGSVPSDAFSYAKTTGGVDFLAVVEHNHLMQDACTTCTAAQILTRYQSGMTAAQTATVAGSFVGIFGMEWGVISGGGHINVYNQNQLMSWTGEPYHVLTDKSNYPMLYTAMKNNQGTLGSYGAFNHPNSSDFGSWVRSADGDAVMRGFSMVSGPAFNTSTTFTPGGSTYGSLFNTTLSKGWKIAPETHQDNHCWNYGNSTPNRTVALIPNGTTFNQASLMSAIGARHFYAQQDRDMQLTFRTTDGARAMGDVFGASAGVPVTVKVSDPAGEGVQKIEIWGGQAGTVASPGAAAAIVASNTASTTLSATLPSQTAGSEWYYYVIAVQADGNIAWSAPMWITWGSGCSTPSATTLSAPSNGATGVSTAPTLSWSAASGATSYDVYFGTATSPAFYSNTASTSLPLSALSNGTTYYWRVVAKNSCGSAASSSTSSFTTVTSCTLPGTPTVSAPANGATGVATSTTLSWSAVSGATGYDVYFGTSASPAFYSSPATNSLAVSGLASNTTHYWRVVAKNACGAGASTGTMSFTTAGGVTTLINEGAESGATGWTFTKNTGSGWSVETTTESYAGAARFKTNVGYTTYLSSADWSAVSPTFSLTGKSSATLTFFNKYKTESGYDYFKVEVSTNGGTSWTQLRSVSGTSTSYPSWASQVSLSLTPYVGNSSVKIRFRFTSDSTVTDWGVAVDNVVVTAQ
jgi:hypothetical protein